MKKTIVALIMAVVCVFAFALTGCGSAFDGNYKEANAEEVNTVVRNVEQAGGEAIDYTVGAKTTMYMNMSASGRTSKISVECNLKVNAGNIELSGKMKASGDSDIDGNVYYKDGYMYMNGRYAGANVKQKHAMSINELMKEIGGDMAAQYMSLPALLAEYGVGKEIPENVKVSLDSGKDAIKVKVEVTLNELGATGSFTAYFVYDANYKLTALKVDGKSSTMFTTEMGLTVEGFDGNISFPSDLDTYEEVK